MLGRVEVGKDGDEGADKGPTELGKMEPLLPPGAPLGVNPDAGFVVYMVPVVWKCEREL